MLDTATTSSITNSMKVPELSSTPIGWIRMNIQASPKNRSSMMKRSRQACAADLGHRQFEELPALGDDDGVDDQHRGGPGAGGDRAGPQARQEADGRHQQQDHQRGRQPVLRVLPQQLVIEGRARAGGRGQPVARLAHVLRGKAALRRRGFRWQRGEIGLFAWNRHEIDAGTHEKLAPTSPKILKSKLKSALKTLVNDLLPAGLTGLFAHVRLQPRGKTDRS